MDWKFWCPWFFFFFLSWFDVVFSNYEPAKNFFFKAPHIKCHLYVAALSNLKLKTWTYNSPNLRKNHCSKTTSWTLLCLTCLLPNIYWLWEYHSFCHSCSCRFLTHRINCLKGFLVWKASETDFWVKLDTLLDHQVKIIRFDSFWRQIFPPACNPSWLFRTEQLPGLWEHCVCRNSKSWLNSITACRHFSPTVRFTNCIFTKRFLDTLHDNCCELCATLQLPGIQQALEMQNEMCHT